MHFMQLLLNEKWTDRLSKGIKTGSSFLLKELLITGLLGHVLSFSLPFPSPLSLSLFLSGLMNIAYISAQWQKRGGEAVT